MAIRRLQHRIAPLMASQASAQALASTEDIISPLRMGQGVVGGGLLATQQDAIEGALNTKLLTPLRAKQLFDTLQKTPRQIDLYRATESGGGARLRNSIPLTGVSVAVMSVLVPLNIGDIVVALGRWEFTTNESTYNTLVVSQMILAASSSSIAPLSGGRFAGGCGGNITPAIHHDFHQLGGMITSSFNSSTTRVNVIAAASSSSGSLNIAIDTNCTLDALVIRKLPT